MKIHNAAMIPGMTFANVPDFIKPVSTFRIKSRHHVIDDEGKASAEFQFSAITIITRVIANFIWLSYNLPAIIVYYTINTLNDIIDCTQCDVKKTQLSLNVQN